MRKMTEAEMKVQAVKSYGDVAIHSVQTALTEVHRRIRDLMGTDREGTKFYLKACRVINDVSIEVVEVVESTNKTVIERELGTNVGV
jgi:hypothetical protein